MGGVILAVDLAGHIDEFDSINKAGGGSGGEGEATESRILPFREGGMLANFSRDPSEGRDGDRQVETQKKNKIGEKNAKQTKNAKRRKIRKTCEKGAK